MERAAAAVAAAHVIFYPASLRLLCLASLFHAAVLHSNRNLRSFYYPFGYLGLLRTIIFITQKREKCSFTFYEANKFSKCLSELRFSLPFVCFCSLVLCGGGSLTWLCNVYCVLRAGTLRPLVKTRNCLSLSERPTRFLRLIKL